MNLLFQRSQSTGISGAVSMPNLPMAGSAPKFKLWAKIELEPDEQAVLDHYHFDKAVVIDALEPDLLRYTAYIAGAGWLISFFVFFWMMNTSAAAFLSLIAGGGAGYFYYDKKRERLWVRDLLHGRYFSCNSIIDLARKEAWLETAVAFVRQVMESAKHWDGTETIKVPVLEKEEAKRFILKGL